MPSPAPFNFNYPIAKDWDSWVPQWVKQFQLFLLSLQMKLPSYNNKGALNALNGVILESPNGTLYKVVVDNTGVLSTTTP